MTPKNRPIDRLVRNIWSSWQGLEEATWRLMKVARDNNAEGDIGSRRFNRGLIGNIQIDRNEFGLAEQAITTTINKIRQEIREQQELKDELRSIELEEEWKKEKKSRKKEFEENEKSIIETHPNYLKLK